MPGGHGKRGRAWCFTLNNYTDVEYQQFCTEELFVLLGAVFICFQKEVAPTTLTPHIQGYIQLGEQKTLKFMKDNFHNRAHYELARGNAEQNKVYCSKPGGTDYFERG
jgi:Putative viral replication protein